MGWQAAAMSRGREGQRVAALLAVLLVQLVWSVAASDDASSVAPEASAACSAGADSSNPQCQALQEEDAVINEREVLQLSPARVMVIVVTFGLMALWILMLCKFTWDGSLPARLALWGFVPEAYSAISVRAVVALLRLKDGPTPVVMLRNCVTDESAEQLAEAIRLYGTKAELQVLEVPQNPKLTLRGLATLVSVILEEESQIVEFDLSYNPQFGDACVKTLEPLLTTKSSKLQTLRAAECSLSETGLLQLSKASTKSQLRTLDLSGNNFGGAPEAIGSLVESPPFLEELRLECCGLKLQEAEAIADELPSTSVATLMLGGNEIGSDGLTAISKSLAQSQIKDLGLESTGLEVACEGLAELAVAWVKRPFPRLRLAGNRMSMEDVASYMQDLRSLL